MNKFEIINETSYKKDIIIKTNKYIKYLLEKLNLNDCIFNVIFVSDEKIKELNKEYRSINKATDVLSFALEDKKDISYEFRLLGDIYIALKYLENQAKEFNNSFENELYLIITHGLLHLLGYDHQEKQAEEEMFKLQEMMVNEYTKTSQKN